MEKDIDIASLSRDLLQLKRDFPLFNHIYPLFNHIYKENTPGVCEIVFGPKISEKTHEITRMVRHYPYADLAKQLYELKEMLPDLLKSTQEIPIVAFSPTEKYHKFASAGLHTNFSVFAEDNSNLFYDPRRASHGYFSPLAQKCAEQLLAVQKEGLPIYAPTPASYKRFGKYELAPSQFGVGYSVDKRFNSVACRSLTSIPVHKHGQHQEDKHIEDRLAGADANPYLVLLAGFGSIYKVLTEPECPVSFSGPTPIKKIGDPGKACDAALYRFEHSPLWKEIAGEKLHRDLVAYFAQNQGLEQDRSEYLPGFR